MKLIGNYMQKKASSHLFILNYFFLGIRKIFYSANGSKVPIPP